MLYCVAGEIDAPKKFLTRSYAVTYAALLFPHAATCPSGRHACFPLRRACFPLRRAKFSPCPLRRCSAMRHSLFLTPCAFSLTRQPPSPAHPPLPPAATPPTDVFLTRTGVFLTRTGFIESVQQRYQYFATRPMKY